MNKVRSFLVSTLSVISLSQAHAGVTVIDFDTDSNGNAITNGQIVDDEYASAGVSITSVNVNNTTSKTSDDIEGIQVAFDTNLSGTEDPDLEYNRNRNDYNGTGQYSYTALNIDGIQFADTPDNVLIMQNADFINDSANGNTCDAFSCTTPNDENGTNPAGYFEFTFDTLVDIISLDTFDIEDNGEFVIQFFANDNLVATRVETDKAVGDTVSIFDSADYTVQAGDDTLLTMGDGQFVRQLLNITGIDRLRVQIPGSGAIDNLAFRTAEVPAPATLSLLAFAMLLIARRVRK
ncbi:hypothetical protein [Paraglaciecola sp. 2405UD69-4]|uniref:hypothetical protein n=1 Tax=Paraglaciecola sp. 2405UD69-4 TaxID=3391836 RepID=UPI0039C981C0